MTDKKRIVSGIQPTGNLHLGNYLGAIRNWVDMQNAMAAGDSCIFFLADLHAVTMPQEPDILAANIRSMAATLLAAGVDPERSVLFAQSDVAAHSELSWLLNCVARIGWLNRMTQFKEKSGKNREGASVGLYTYPVLQAADVMLYQATHVPVGEDQKQHLELARDIATKFNNDYQSEVFTLPQPIIQKTAARVMSLRNGSAKMSKSDPSDLSRINLTDSNDDITQKIRKAKTDPDPIPDNEAALTERPEARNLLTIYSALSGKAVPEILNQFAGQGFGQFKPILSDLMISIIGPIRDRLFSFQSDPAEIDRLLLQGAKKAETLAAVTLEKAYYAMGLRRRN
ncbi:MAG: tryptophan--tRNA ligase [Zymomonas mobilis subsp. pomaceae]|uniref:Tryptophan--tRNA ligase n=1 Tax=Zymomonas mobilis subsp. pomaceae (strain ATCC 29192 / DSM 22645 / JCM 10191 / CCUG 17912 / NBRC 13757 / NCIMB 11200 / NRRL B-4491 / Barker I) TaxID=579138 RepID=F8EVN2_ZYMMT|nr:tryptophan--tRNA ligase [Zymomonas mobilis]AEI38369.1 tryptophanyl-tRNA synthetase [Zymomonas mobilis subsp. pomaceae ATCC 29192]MDX5948058.1 tryptophan--tRNA ligase [Zymomonas mobilis subsp. pomaceae]GEB89388.1 tryptophan--tRNA ligase [Zymomonas mobilis subsp. pomaceae]